MRQLFRSHFVLITACALSGLTSTLVAQQGKRPAISESKPASKPASPGVEGKSTPKDPPARERKDYAAEKLSPELEKLLARWEKESALIKSMHGFQTRREFTAEFSVEKVSKGEFFVEPPDRGRIDMIAVIPKKGDVSSRKSYTLATGESMRYICTGDEIIQFDEIGKTYDRHDLPENMRGKNIVHSPLPFLFGIKVEEVKRRFELAMSTPEKDVVWIKAIPRPDSDDRKHYREARIMLDTTRFVPKLVKLMDPDGIESVYEFSDIKINDSGFGKKLLERFKGDPYKPSVKGYTRFVANEGNPAESDAVIPVGNKVLNQKQPIASGKPLQRNSAEASSAKTGPPRTFSQESRK